MQTMRARAKRRTWRRFPLAPGTDRPSASPVGLRGIISLASSAKGGRFSSSQSSGSAVRLNSIKLSGFKSFAEP
ncbi:hypothetical protein, partial [Hydrogenophaga sp.]|uniref:hypothetical protein n=1 Tax=Hydrogenophaga sp. TaxID=1904254 RepID=UPI0026227D5F